MANCLLHVLVRSQDAAVIVANISNGLSAWIYQPVFLLSGLIIHSVSVILMMYDDYCVCDMQGN